MSAYSKFLSQKGEIATSLAIFSVFIITMGLVVGFAASQQDTAFNRSSEAQTSEAEDLGRVSRWFEGQASGQSCGTWFTCKSGGAQIKKISIKDTDAEFILEEDIFGNDPRDVTFTSCQGNDEGISIEYNPADVQGYSQRFKDLYNIDDGDEIVLSIKTGGGAANKYYVYDRPEGMTLGDQAGELVIEFEAETAGVTELYAQQSQAKACAVGGGGEPDPSTSPSPDPSPSISPEPDPSPDPTRETVKHTMNVTVEGYVDDESPFLGYWIDTCTAENTCGRVFSRFANLPADHPQRLKASASFDVAVPEGHNLRIGSSQTEFVVDHWENSIDEMTLEVTNDIGKEKCEITEVNDSLKLRFATCEFSEEGYETDVKITRVLDPEVCTRGTVRGTITIENGLLEDIPDGINPWLELILSARADDLTPGESFRIDRDTPVTTEPSTYAFDLNRNIATSTTRLQFIKQIRGVGSGSIPIPEDALTFNCVDTGGEALNYATCIYEFSQENSCAIEDIEIKLDLAKLVPETEPEELACTIDSEARLFQCNNEDCSSVGPLELDDSNRTGFTLTNNKPGDHNPAYFTYKAPVPQAPYGGETLSRFYDRIDPNTDDKFGDLYAVGEQAYVTFEHPQNYEIVSTKCDQTNGSCQYPFGVGIKTVAGLNMACGNIIDYSWTLAKCENVGPPSTLQCQTANDKRTYIGGNEVHGGKSQAFVPSEGGQLMSLYLDVRNRDSAKSSQFNVYITRTAQGVGVPIESVLAQAQVTLAPHQRGVEVIFDNMPSLVKGQTYAIVIPADEFNRSEGFTDVVDWYYAQDDNCVRGRSATFFRTYSPPRWVLDGNDFHFKVTVQPTSCARTAFLLAEKIAAADVNQDGIVNLFDYTAVAEALGTTNASGREDVDGDGKVDVLDLSIVITHLFEEVSPSFLPITEDLTEE